MQEVKEHIATKKLVPQLRFKEFDEEWKKYTLKFLLGALVDCEHKTAPYVEDSEYLVVRTNNVKKGQLVYNDIKYTTEEGFNEWTKRTVPKFGDILFTREAPAGESCLVPNDKKVCLGQRMVLLRSNKNKMTGQYLSSYLQSGSAIRDISNLSIGTTVTRINIADINKLKCPVSTIPEQQKIASFLSAVDEKIQQLTKKKELLEQYKKGVMQQLFSGQLRFKDENGNPYPDWEGKKRLGELIKLQGGNAFKSSQFKKVGIPIIRISNISNKTKYLDLEKLVHYDEEIRDANYIIEQGDLLIAMSGATTGKSSISDFEGKAYLNQRVGLFKSISHELEYGFLIQFVFCDFFTKQLDGVLVAGAQPNISSKDIENFKLNFPCLEEQQKIATYLSHIDTKLETVNNQITQTQTFKKGLLQQMFV